MTKHFRILGRFPNDRFVDWIVKRAHTLSLNGHVAQLNDSEIALTVAGHPILVDAMEVACSLGPIDASVDLITEEKQLLPQQDRQSAQIVRYFGHQPPVRPLMK